MTGRVQIVDGQTIAWDRHESSHRTGSISFKRYRFDPCDPELRLEWSIAAVHDGYMTPRHRHNYDQLRYVLNGEMSVDPKRTAHARSCSYYPEGTYYGPQRQVGECEVLTLQVPGSSRAPFLDYDDVRGGFAELRKAGARFEGGAVQREGGRSAQDGFEAVWEAKVGRPISYAPPRFGDVVLMEPDHFQWRDSPDPAVERKHLATFGEDRISVGFERWSGPVRQTIAARGGAAIYHLLRGSFVHAGQTYGEQSAVFLLDGENIAADAPGDAEWLVVRLPLYAAMSGAKDRPAGFE